MTMLQFALRGVFVILTLWLAAPAMCQGPTLPREVFSKRDLTNEDRAAIAAYVAHWLPRLATPSSEADAYTQINAAFRALGSAVFGSLELSPFFRSAYSETLSPELERLIAGEDAAAASRAMYLAGRLGTDAGLNLLVEQIGHENVLRRNAAARSARLAVHAFQEGARASMVSAATISALARTVERAATAETSPFALQRQNELLDAIYNAAMARAEVLPDLTSLTQDARLRVLAAQAKTITGDEADALTMMISTLRGHYQAVDRRRASDGPRLAASINAILATCLVQWDAARTDPATNQAYRRLIADCENFLIFIDSTLRTASAALKTQFKESWDRNDKPQFERDHQQVVNMLQMDPYNRGG